MIVVEKTSSVLVGDGDDDRTQCLRKWGRLKLADSDIELEQRKFLVKFQNGAARYVVPEEGFNMALGTKNN